MVRLFPLSPPAAAVVEWHSPQSLSPYLCLYHLGQLSCCIDEIDVLASLHLKNVMLLVGMAIPISQVIALKVTKIVFAHTMICFSISLTIVI